MTDPAQRAESVKIKTVWPIASNCLRNKQPSDLPLHCLLSAKKKQKKEYLQIKREFKISLSLEFVGGANLSIWSQILAELVPIYTVLRFLTSVAVVNQTDPQKCFRISFMAWIEACNSQLVPPCPCHIHNINIRILLTLHVKNIHFTVSNLTFLMQKSHPQSIKVIGILQRYNTGTLSLAISFLYHQRLINSSSQIEPKDNQTWSVFTT